MTTEQVSTMLGSLGIPTAYYQFPDTQQGPPFLCFFFGANNDALADNENYVRIDRLIVELYTETKDFDLEKALETILAAHGLVWTKDTEQLDDEHMTEVVYEMDVIITED